MSTLKFKYLIDQTKVEVHLNLNIQLIMAK